MLGAIERSKRCRPCGLRLIASGPTWRDSRKSKGKGGGKNDERGGYVAAKPPDYCKMCGKYGHKAVGCWQKQVKLSGSDVKICLCK